MKTPALLAAAVLAALPLASFAADWTGTGELGLALARGNARSENLNGKLAFATEDANWKHAYHLSVLRAKGEVTGDFDGDGLPEERFELNANRYEFGATSALKMNEVSSWIAALRYENDDFAPYDHQTTFSLGYGHQFIRSDTTSLAAEIGPGYRRAKSASTGETESEAILRGLLDYKHKLTSNTELFNTLLVESGSDNTFAQNDFGVAVAMNESFALKAGLQLRHNTDVGPGIDKTDTLTTVNLVYNIK
jgi:putative salt-induced outer membrane protein